MPVEFFGGPLDGQQEHSAFKAQNEIWIVPAHSRHFAIYHRKTKPDGVIFFEFERYCDEAEAKRLKGAE
jgi:hypothetical protein